MNPTFFVSDLHLCETRPHPTRLFLDFLQRVAPQAGALYILGDLFEYWAGDDDLHAPLHQALTAAFSRLADRGTEINLMHGNRDFLIGSAFASQARVRLVADPLLIDLHGRKALITHGDELCTDDVAYQEFRKQIRASQWQQQFLALPLAQRKGQIAQLRARSEHEKSEKSAEIMDVNAAAVETLLRQYAIPPLLIHGHTHRPARHQLVLDGKPCERIVLADWGDVGSYLACDAAGCVERPVS